jgi:predicted nucleotidyltransferase
LRPPPRPSDPLLDGIGGASIHLWLTDPGAPPKRATDDVDLISAITTRAGYYRLGEQLRARGFSEAGDSPVICRWRHLQTGLLLDVMPLGENVLGFSNHWYQHAIEAATERRLPSGARIHAATSPSIIATELAAWHGRRKGDMLASLDLHDILVDGRPELPDEIGSEPAELRTYTRARGTTGGRRRSRARPTHDGSVERETFR